MDGVSLNIAGLVAELGLIIQREAQKNPFREGFVQAIKYRFSGGKISWEAVVGEITQAFQNVSAALLGVKEFSRSFHLGLLRYNPPVPGSKTPRVDDSDIQYIYSANAMIASEVNAKVVSVRTSMTILVKIANDGVDEVKERGRRV